MYQFTYDTACDVLNDPNLTVTDVLADPDGWATAIANRAVVDPDDLVGRFTFLADVDPDDVVAADRAISADGDHDGASRDYAMYTDFVVWHVVRADARGVLKDADQVRALLPTT